MQLRLCVSAPAALQCSFDELAYGDYQGKAARWRAANVRFVVPSFGSCAE
jgi:hypothetical protein